MKKSLLIIALVSFTAAAAFGYYMFNKPHQSILSETPAFSSEASALVSEYEADENASNAKYLGKVIEVTGTVSDKSTDNQGVLNITLQGGDLAGIGCQFDKKNQADAIAMKSGDKVKVKGICTGILMDVVLVDCVISTNAE
jgi:hypothetical protein